MTARKPKTARQIALEWVDKDDKTHGLPSRYRAHLAGQRTGYARARREVAAVLRTYLAEYRANDCGAEGWAVLIIGDELKIKLENV